MTLTWSQQIDWNRQSQKTEALDNAENMRRKECWKRDYHETGRKITGLVISSVKSSSPFDSQITCMKC